MVHWSFMEDLDKQVKVQTRMIEYTQRHGMGNNTIRHKEILQQLQRRIKLHQDKIARRKAYKLKLHKLEFGVE